MVRDTIPVQQSPVAPGLDRLIALVFVGVGAAMVWLLMGIRPDGRGFGTHEQLGMTPCGWPVYHGIPCPTCGVTTAAAHLVHLEPLAALQVQPFGAVLALAGIFAALFAGYCLLFGRSLVDIIARLPYGTLLLGGLALLLGSWLYKYLTFAP